MSDGNLSCRVPGCMETFNHRQSRIRHENKSHDTSELEANRPIVGGRLCGICGEMVKDILLLCAHVENSHGIQARIITEEFSSELEFNAWKSDIHQTSSAEFGIVKTEKGKGGAKKLLLCHRTGSYQPIGGTSVNSRAPRETPTIKIGFDCTAFISVKQVDGKFIARTCLDHYGHTMDPKLLHIDAKTQAKVVRMLKEDRHPAWIVKEIRSKGKGREKLIRTKDILNIRYHKIKVPVPKPVEDSTDTISEKLVSALKKMLISVESGEVRDKIVLTGALEKVIQANSLIETVGQSTAFKAQKKVSPGQNFDHQGKYKRRRKEKKVLDDSFEEEI